MRTTFPGTAFNGSAIFDDDGLRDDGTVDQEVVCILEHEVVCGEFSPFFDRNGRIGMNMQICMHVTAAKGDYILSVAFNKEASEVKSEGVMRNDEQTHNLSGFKLLEDNMPVFFPSIGKNNPVYGHLPQRRLQVRHFFTHPVDRFRRHRRSNTNQNNFPTSSLTQERLFLSSFFTLFSKKLAEDIEVEVGI